MYCNCYIRLCYHVEPKHVVEQTRAEEGSRRRLILDHASTDPTPGLTLPLEPDFLSDERTFIAMAITRPEPFEDELPRDSALGGSADAHGLASAH